MDRIRDVPHQAAQARILRPGQEREIINAIEGSALYGID